MGVPTGKRSLSPTGQFVRSLSCFEWSEEGLAEGESISSLGRMRSSRSWMLKLFFLSFSWATLVIRFAWLHGDVVYEWAREVDVAI